ncbi:unnamed protein product [Chondrus crispus]|uniref:Gfo/Idh/MocA-like oxidoreductase N-terminal domain-containing protein n=1 Tax=Chondrus crispus TaxID=2769 RepID=R7Q3G2_CHOCR|nr:unnamed protein product [Chondrus crispus]CDF33082.1 unnamed protein product [Chondrus crispus]|eukprot:XP_005712885.1 unnamed protein product [Chondrus crispus]
MTTDPPLTTYGVVGVGLMGIEHLRNLFNLPAVSIVCIADNHPGSLQSCLSIIAAESPATAEHLSVFDSAADLFAANLCDIAIIATPNHTHHSVLMHAYEQANSAMHILVEKPLCTTIPHCREVILAAGKRQGITFVGLEYSYMPPVRNWNRFSANSGGTFVEKCCHFFDLFNRIMRPHTPLAVMASGGQDVNHLDEVYDGVKSDILDNGYVIIEYSGGRRACLDLCMFAEASRSQEEVAITGDKGKLEAFLPQLEVRTGIRGKHACGDVEFETVDDERIKYRGHHHGSSYLEHIDILKAVRGVKTGECVDVPTSGLHHGLLSVAIGVAAQLSIQERRFVKLEEVLSAEELARSV